MTVWHILHNVPIHNKRVTTLYIGIERVYIELQFLNIVVPMWLCILLPTKKKNFVYIIKADQSNHCDL